MGTFMGHVLPGSFFLFFGIWWTIQISARYYRCKYSPKGPAYRSTVTFLVPTRCCGDWQMEGYAKLLLCSFGLVMEIITGFNSSGSFAYMGNGQHATMFFFFGFCGLVDILLHHKVPLPKHSDYVISVMATFVEGLLFKFHLHGRTDLDVQVHTLLVYAIFIQCIVVVSEVSWPTNVMFIYGRAFLTLLQGTWFYQVAFILYNPFPDAAKWDGEDHMQIMLSTIFFAWHMMAIFIFMLLVALVTSCYHRRRASGKSQAYRDDEMAMERLITKDLNGHTMLALNQDSDSDLEFQQPVNKS